MAGEGANEPSGAGGTRSREEHRGGSLPSQRAVPTYCAKCVLAGTVRVVSRRPVGRTHDSMRYL